MRSKQPKKRLIIDLEPSQHAELVERAKRLGLTISNMVRRVLMLPEEYQGLPHGTKKKNDKDA